MRATLLRVVLSSLAALLAVTSPIQAAAAATDLTLELERDEVRISVRGPASAPFFVTARFEGDGLSAASVVARGIVGEEGIATRSFALGRSASSALAGRRLVLRAWAGASWSSSSSISFTPAGPQLDGAQTRRPMRVESCSLGCMESSSGTFFFCSVTDVHVNEEIRIGFSNPIDLNTVSSFTFQVIDVSTGQTPPATFFLDPNDPRVLVYQPSLQFDSSGNPIFGLDEDETYTLRVPGTLLDPLGPYVSDIAGSANETRVLCTLVASKGVRDEVPGAPSAAVTVDVVTAYDQMTGEPSDFDFDVPADGATDVYRETDITITFDDVMFPPSVIDVLNGTSPSVHVQADPDGDLQTTGDRFDIAGSFSLTIDHAGNETRLVFDPDDSLPASGGGSSPLLIVVTLDASIQDLGLNALSNPGSVSFEPED